MIMTTAGLIEPAADIASAASTAEAAAIASAASTAEATATAEAANKKTPAAPVHELAHLTAWPD